MSRHCFETARYDLMGGRTRWDRPPLPCSQHVVSTFSDPLPGLSYSLRPSELDGTSASAWEGFASSFGCIEPLVSSMLSDSGDWDLITLGPSLIKCKSSSNWLMRLHNFASVPSRLLHHLKLRYKMHKAARSHTCQRQLDPFQHGTLESQHARFASGGEPGLRFESAMCNISTSTTQKCSRVAKVSEPCVLCVVCVCCDVVCRVVYRVVCCVCDVLYTRVVCCADVVAQ